MIGGFFQCALCAVLVAGRLAVTRTVTLCLGEKKTAQPLSAAPFSAYVHAFLAEKLFAHAFHTKESVSHSPT